MSQPQELKKPPDKNQTIKMRFKAKTPAIKAWISDSVDVVSTIAVHLSRFANMYVLYCCENNLPLPEIDNVFYNNVMYLVTNTQMADFADQRLQKAFRNLYQPFLFYCTPTRTTDQYRFLERLTLEMETNSRVYLKTQFISRFRQWCTHFVTSIVVIDDKDLQLVEKKRQRWKIVNYLFQQTVKTDSCVFDISQITNEANTALSQVSPLLWSQDIAVQLSKEIADTRQELNLSIVKGDKVCFCRPVTGTKLLRTDLSPCYLRWLYKHLCALEQHNKTPNVKQRKVYSMLPIRCLDRSYISISQTALREWIYRNRKDQRAVGKELYDKINEIGDKDAFLKEFEKEKLWYWQQCFDFQNALHGKSEFTGPILTDGYACSVVTKKECSEKELRDRDAAVITLSDDERESDRKTKIFTQEELDSSDIVGVDPGRKTLYTSVFEVKGEKHKVATYSAGRWRHVSGGNEAKRKREGWSKKRSPEYNAWLLSMPSTKVATVAGMQIHMQHLMLRLAECLEENGKIRVRKQKFCGYVLKQKGLSQMVEEFISQTERAGSEKKNLIVAFGDAAFKTSGPVKKMKVELQRRSNVQLVNVDEFHTSLMMTCCAFAGDGKAIERQGPLATSKTKDGEEREARLYSVSYCQNCTCYWNRDVNAAINILRVFEHAQQHRGARHEFFSRSVATSKKQKKTAAKKRVTDETQAKSRKKSKSVEAITTSYPLREERTSVCLNSSLEE